MLQLINGYSKVRINIEKVKVHFVDRCGKEKVMLGLQITLLEMVLQSITTSF